MKRYLLTAALSCAALLTSQTPDAKSAGPEVGKPTPTIRLNDHEGNVVAIGGEGERWCVLAFYPKAMTPG